MSSRFICIHGHFYQPPRENPWLGEVETQESAHPFHDWNERITAECYRPNAAPHLLDAEGRPVAAASSYAKISFNFGPTLLSWLEAKAPDVYAAVLEGDRASAARCSGHGSAIAQAYNHAILPLANRRDKVTQTAWGIRDFERRFGRLPEGFWLPETAVDLESLEVLAEQGILFTILAPHQAGRARRTGAGAWTDVREDTLDTRRPYRVLLPSGREIAVFFYDGPVSRGVAFDHLLDSGDLLASRLLGRFDAGAPSGGDQLVHIATDGETYGHHHRFGDMALAFALHRLEAQAGVRLTNYGEYLAAHPPEAEASILEGTSWSCSHGLGRWKEDCGCRTHPDMSQEWRAPLREALDRLRDGLALVFEARAGELLDDPWAARNDYAAVVFDPGPAARDAFLRRHARRLLTSGEGSAVLLLMELQRNALLMFTSCGWFFDDVAGLEGRQILQYAGRAIELAERIEGSASGLENLFLEALAAAKSNDPEQGDARRVYEQFVRPARAARVSVPEEFGMFRAQ